MLKTGAKIKMKKSLYGVFLFAVSLSLALTEAAALEITSKWKIIRPEKADPEINAAAEQVRKYITLTTGIDLPIVSQGQAPAVKIVRNNTLGSEEWAVKAQKNALLISGGANGGVLFGAYEFIEKALGCRYLAPKTVYLPKKKRLVIADNFALSGKPVFKKRAMYFAQGDNQELRSWLKITGGEPYRGVLSPWRYGSFGGCHTFRRYSQLFPKDRPEYLSMNEKGERVLSHDYDDMGPGQICLTHPEVRVIVAEQMKKLIRQDRVAARKAGLSAPLLYHLSRNDVPHDCVCPGCLALLKKYKGNHSGVNLEFVNDVARRVGKEFPDVRIVTFAYMTDEKAPEGLIAEKNVIVEIAQLGAEFSSGKRDSLRSLKHPLNVRALKMIEEWKQKNISLMIWDYWTLYRTPFAFPHVGISGLVENLKYYHSIGIDQFFAETEITPTHLESFIDLRTYVGAKLLVDPAADAQKIIDDFMKHYFGPAAKPMKEYLTLLEKAVTGEKKAFGGFSPASATYLNEKFFTETGKLFAQAEKAAANDKEILKRIGQEQIPVDIALAHVSSRLSLKIDRPQLKSRLQKNLRNFTEKYCSSHPEKWETSFQRILSSLFSFLPLPEQFSDRKGLDFFGDKFRTVPHGGEAVVDPEACGKISLRLPVKLAQDKPDIHRRPLQFQFYDWTKKQTLLTKIIPVAKYPKDEKYHWYFVGQSRVSPRTTLALHQSWRLSSPLGSGAYDPTHPDAKYDIWVSIRLTGPSYVPGSKKPDSLHVDRILFLEAAR